MFSVIIPLYNKSPYIEKALRSVQAQTFREFEVIVVDDGSTDNSWEVARQLIEEFQSDQTASPLGGFRGVSQSNQGVSQARNNGVKLTNYPYICFLDADDWWEPTFLEEMAALITEFPDAGIYGTGYYIVKNGKLRMAPIGVEADFEKGTINYCQVYAKTLCMPLTSISVCIPKTIFESENGFKPHLKLGEDFDLWIRIAMKHAVVFRNKPLAYYNQDVEQTTRGVVDDKIYDPSTFVTFHLDFLKEDEKSNTDLKILLDRLRVYSLLRYRLQGAFTQQVSEIISTVDFNNIEKKYCRYYKFPLFLVRFWFGLFKIGNKIINTLKK